MKILGVVLCLTGLAGIPLTLIFVKASPMGVPFFVFEILAVIVGEALIVSGYLKK